MGKAVPTTGDVYYGSTKYSLEYRRSKGWYTCSCNYFENPKCEVLETVEDEEIDLDIELLVMGEGGEA